MRYGRELRPLWLLEPGARFLNHGSFGACPKTVLEAQARLRLEMEAQPDRFMRERVMPDAGATALRAAIERLAAFVGSDPEGVVLVENATAGVQAVVRSIAFAPGDEILIADHTYNAVRLIVEARCAETGARVRRVTLPLPSSADAIVERYRDALAPAVKLVIVDHITSPTALLFPLARLMPELRRWGARVLVDGAHAVGHVDLDLAALGADWYVSNAHKWLFAPKGTAFLYAAAAVRAITAPLVVSHYVGLGFPRSFEWVGTRDYTGWLVLPEALAFFDSLEPARARAHRAGLVAYATRKFTALDLEPVGTEDLTCSIRSFRLPQRRAAEAADATALVDGLWQRDRIQAMAVAFEGALLLRISAQAYVDEEDIEALAASMERRGWPGR